jgi:hypothetical protein
VIDFEFYIPLNLGEFVWLTVHIVDLTDIHFPGVDEYVTIQQNKSGNGIQFSSHLCPESTLLIFRLSGQSPGMIELFPGFSEITVFQEPRKGIYVYALVKM